MRAELPYLYPYMRSHLCPDVRCYVRPNLRPYLCRHLPADVCPNVRAYLRANLRSNLRSVLRHLRPYVRAAELRHLRPYVRHPHLPTKLPQCRPAYVCPHVYHLPAPGLSAAAIGGCGRAGSPNRAYLP